MCAGSLFAFLKEAEDLEHSIAIWQQLLRNVGNALILSWVCIFHWKYFILEKRPIKKVIKKKKTSKK
jgi:hypothetical protein